MIVWETPDIVDPFRVFGKKLNISLSINISRSVQAPNPELRIVKSLKTNVFFYLFEIFRLSVIIRHILHITNIILVEILILQLIQYWSSWDNYTGEVMNWTIHKLLLFIQAPKIFLCLYKGLSTFIVLLAPFLLWPDKHNIWHPFKNTNLLL